MTAKVRKCYSPRGCDVFLRLLLRDPPRRGEPRWWCARPDVLGLRRAFNSVSGACPGFDLSCHPLLAWQVRGRAHGVMFGVSIGISAST